MNAAIMGLSRAEIDTRYDEIAAFAHIGSIIDWPVKTYSSGMHVRLAFATAISETCRSSSGAYDILGFSRIVKDMRKFRHRRVTTEGVRLLCRSATKKVIYTVVNPDVTFFEVEG